MWQTLCTRSFEDNDVLVTSRAAEVVVMTVMMVVMMVVLMVMMTVMIMVMMVVMTVVMMVVRKGRVDGCRERVQYDRRCGGE